MPPRSSPTVGPPVIPGLRYVADLGSGGFADVYAYACDLPFRVVAVKVLRSCADVTSVVGEANALARLDHPHIVAIYDAGCTNDGRPFLVTMLCPLPTLALRCRPAGLGVPDLLDLGVRLAGALATAHDAGILHRDVKPANVLTSRYGQPMLADFGLAGRGVHEEAGWSPGWAPPEVTAGFDASAASDVYGLAATLWTAATGRVPVDGPRWTPPARLSFLPGPVADVLEAGLAPDPTDRPAGMAVLGALLGDAQDRLGLPRTPWLVPFADPASGLADVRRASVEVTGRASVVDAAVLLDASREHGRVTMGGGAE